MTTPNTHALDAQLCEQYCLPGAHHRDCPNGAALAPSRADTAGAVGDCDSCGGRGYLPFGDDGGQSDVRCPDCRTRPAESALSDTQCAAIYKAVQMAGITRDVKSPERIREIVREAANVPAPAGDARGAVDDFVPVPRETWDWLMGASGDFECPESEYYSGKPPPYWWRRELTRRVAAAPTPATPSGQAL